MSALATVLTNPAIINLLVAEAPVLVEDIVALFKKHPQLTPDVLAQLAAAVHAVNADTLKTIAADQAAHPG